ncbi:MAG: hypothetical protein IPP94_18530 [Ignavibacteria bacterium]|nr:hypothetical protein [Ignavibacteria bacterium]
MLCLLGLTTWYEKTVPDEPAAIAAMSNGELSLDEVKEKLALFMAELEQSHREPARADARRAG